VVANRYVMSVERPGEEPVRVASSPVQFGGGFVEARRPAAEIGAHTEEVLLEAGYSWDDIARLKEAGAIV
jgi:crotonobetainyl-CoA:carnitine CoA-transferase CaiB-like acyl-CoA transferase